MKTLRQRGYSLVEVVIVVAILSVIAVTGYRCLMYLTKEATQTSRAVTNPQRAQYDRFVGVLNDRLGQTWAFTAETASLPGINGNLLRLYNADGQEFADFGIYTDGTVYQYQIADAGGPAPLDFKYAFTNQDSTWDYSLQLTTNATVPSLDVTASWKVPPPFYTAPPLRPSAACSSAPTTRIWSDRCLSTGPTRRVCSSTTFGNTTSTRATMHFGRIRT